MSRTGRGPPRTRGAGAGGTLRRGRAAGPALASVPANLVERETTAVDLGTVGLLAALNAASSNQALRSGSLDAAVDRAAAGLAHRRSGEESTLETRRAGRTETLGIGALASDGGQIVYPSVYAGSRAPRLQIRDARSSRRLASIFARLTDRVSECYGQPLAGHNEASDRVTVGVAIDANGRVLAADVVRDAKWGARDLADCLVPALRASRFPAEVGPVELRYTWSFNFQASDISFE